MNENVNDTLAEYVLGNPDIFIKILERYKERGEKLSYLDSITSSRGLVTITEIAKDYGMSGQGMNTLLHKLGIQYKQSGRWLLYNKYQDCGYTHTLVLRKYHSSGMPFVVHNMLWTQKGREFLYLFLKKHGIVPTIEKYNDIPTYQNVENLISG